MINILLLSVGTRNKIVQYFKKALTATNGRRLGYVIATDMSDIAPAIYVADKFYQVPKITENGYINTIFDICKKEHIAAVLSLIDPELSLLAGNQSKFADIGVTVIGSNYNLCEMCLDKMQMYKWLVEHGYKTARSYIDKKKFYQDVESGKISYPVFVKPISGSSSIAICKVEDKESVDVLL